MAKWLGNEFEGTEYLSSQDANTILVLLHGAGAGAKHPWIIDVANRLNHEGYDVLAANFPYMQEQYRLDKKRPPNRAPQLLAFIDELVAKLPHRNIILVGKSMGARMATLWASTMPNERVRGICALGFPFHPPGKIDKVASRIEHFNALTTQIEIFQGERDPFGNPNTLQDLSFQTNKYINLNWVFEGDHNLTPTKRSGSSLDDNLQHVVGLIVNSIKVWVE